MPTEKDREQDDVVPVKDALEHAVLGVLRGAAVGLHELIHWGKGAVRKEPSVIYDLNGQVLFYDFEIKRGAVTLGYARIAANPLVGTPDVAFEIGARTWNFDAAARKLGPKVRREFPGAKIGTPRLVCYSYPKLGVLFEITGTGGPSRVIYDVASFDRIPERPERPEIEGAYAWSFLDAISDEDRRARRQRFAKFEKARLAISAKVRREIVAARSLDVAMVKVKFRWQRTVTRKLQYCNHYNETEARSHHCFSLHAQEVNDYCAVATAQMVLCYYRYYFTQDHIAPSLGYNAGSGCPADQSGGWESLTCNHLDASYDTAATWEKGRDQIELLRPFKSGIPGHARACAGHSSTVWLLLLGGVTDKKLYIYDPWPWNADLKLGGAVYWEDWDSITHTNYVTARIDCP